MISIDDHPPPDPSSDYQNHHQQQQQQVVFHDLKINSDEKAPAAVSDIDLLKSPGANLDDTNKTPPNFSIRDYVFSSRSKDIACNWPFSIENLELCLDHGVKNLLPPFQSLDLLRSNSSVSRCAVESRLPNAEIVSSFDGKPTDDRFLSVTSCGIKSNQELALEKTENATIQSAIKKCKFLTNLNSGVEPTKEVTPNNLFVSETMASKICPVCKTFSSSSNTTLNAHIDQCLSGESSMKWTANPKIMIKYRIKPRKTKLMVDIYETAARCTVEELDRRNGTSWATNSNFPDQELEFQGEEEKEKPREPTFIPEVADHEGAVYIDTDGTKVRILSVAKVSTSDDHGARKSQKGGRGSKVHTEKKKNNACGQKHLRKFLKLRPNSKKFCSLKPHHGASEVRSDREENVAIEESCNKEDRDRKPVKAKVHMQTDDLAITRPPWACSKRTGLAKKFSGKDGLLYSGRDATKDLLVESDKSFSGCGSETIPSSSDNMSSSQRSKKVRTSSLYRERPLTTNKVVKFSSGSPVGNCAKKRFAVLTKPKQGPRLHDSCEDIKFSSLKKNLLSVSRERIPGSKFNLKRKFSALKKSRVLCLSMENAVVGPSQDSSEEKSRMEEDTSENLSFDRVNVLKVKKKKISFTSKSSNGDSSGGLEIAFIDPLLDVESAKTESHCHGEQVGIVPAPIETGVEGSFMSLRNSLNDEFLKLVSQLDNKFDSQECMELYQGQLRSPKCTLDDIKNNMMGHNIEDGMDDTEKQGNYFEEVEPIPIPGPPGSFLPSPGGDMVSEELQGNSSLTTMSRVQSSEDQHHRDAMDRDSMSDSPISAVSNPSLARSDSRCSDKLSVRFTSLEDTRLGYTGGVVDAIDEKSTPITSSLNASDWRSVDAIFTEKGPTPIGFQNDQPCCCSRKDGASSHTVASEYQESALLGKRALESNSRPSSSEMFSLINYPTLPPPPETVVFSPTMKLPADASSKLSVYKDCDTAVSPPKPVLRLMGKNLTVVETDDDAPSSQQFRPPPHSSPVGHQQLRNVQNEDYNSFFLGYPSQPRHFNVHPPNNSRSHVDSRPIHASDTMFPSTTSGLMAPVDCYRLDTQMARESNALKPTQEIIIIDDTSENEADDGMLNEHMRRNQASSSSSTPMHHQSHSSAHPYGGGVSPVLRNGSVQTSLPLREVVNDGNLGRWGCTQTDSSSMLHASSLGSPLLSALHMRSSTAYYPPSFS